MENFNPENDTSDKRGLSSHYLNRLNLLLNDFSNEIPAEVVHSFATNNKFKVRAAWWSSVSLNIHGLNKKGLIPLIYVSKYRQICEIHMRDIGETGLTKAESIVEVNLLIKDVIEYLEKQNVN